MRLSAFSVVDHAPAFDGGRDRYREVLALAESADASGLDTLWVAEHHFHSGGVCPSPPVLLAAAGARTERLRLGVLVGVLPFHSPVELAEQYALVDRLTGGRLSIGVGSGYIPAEFEGFGVPLESKRELFDRNFDLLLSALRGEPVQASASARGPVRLNVRPVQRPHPPVRVAVQRREAIRFLARRGLSIALIPYATVAGVPELAEEIREYRSELPAGVRGDVAVAVHLYAGDDPGAARGALQQYLDSRRSTQSTFYQARVEADPRLARAEAIEASGLAVFDSSDRIGQRLAVFRAAGVDELLGIFDFGGLPLEQVLRSVRAVGGSATELS